MTATERLRALLDERGVEYREWDGVHPTTIWHDEQSIYEYMERTLLNGVKPHTGEVLDGSGRLEAVIHDCTPEQAIAATLGSGTLTAEQVREAIEVNSWAETSSIREFNDSSWQAIADELNAALGRGTCKLEETESYPSERGMVHVLECSNCGRECEHVNGDYEHCPHCLARNELF